MRGNPEKDSFRFTATVEEEEDKRKKKKGKNKKEEEEEEEELEGEDKSFFNSKVPFFIFFMFCCSRIEREFFLTQKSLFFFV